MTGPPVREGSSREAWRRQRLEMERGQVKHTPEGRHQVRHWNAFKAMVGLFGIGLRILGLYERGLRNARDIGLTRLELWFEELPPALDGFRLLQLTDLHVDFLPETLQSAERLAAGQAVDLCVLTGDYRRRVRGPFEQIMPAMGALARAVTARHGICAVLGNHDCADMVEAFEAEGIAVLINETRTIQRDGAALQVTGTDDVHYYYSDAARQALAATPEGFKLALIHSPELADAAAENGFHLYLAGHTHGGQISLPGGRPIITHMSRFRRYARGLWRHGAMQGYTSSGVGVSGLPVRFNTRGEVVLIMLRSGPGPRRQAGRAAEKPSGPTGPPDPAS